MIIGEIKINYTNKKIKYTDEKKFLNDIKEFINYQGITSINVISHSKELGKKVDEIFLNEFGC